MLDCLIVGDSLASGTAAALRSALFDRCLVSAQVGASTNEVASLVPAGSYNTVVISAGSNDADSADLLRRLERLRAGVSARYVLWELPYNRRAAQLVRFIAGRYGDNVTDLGELATNDGIHPRTYRGLAKAVARGGYGGQQSYGQRTTAR